jgi:hypothetical protein
LLEQHQPPSWSVSFSTTLHKKSVLLEFYKKSLPRHQITFLESVGGSVEQQKQSLEGLQASTLKPPNFPLSLTLLLTSETTKGAFDTFIQACRIEVVAFCLSAHI